VILLPPTLVFFCFLCRNRLDHPYFSLRFGSLFEGLDPTRPLSMLYFPVFTLRRLLFAWTAVFLTDNALY